MSSPWVIAAPEYVAAAASDLANIGSSLGSANMAALAPTSGVLAAGADEVSAMIAALFSSHAQAYQALSAQAASFHAQFVQLMNGGASKYALTEAANASPLLTAAQGAMGAVNAPVQALTGRPLFGNGANATTPGTPGGNSEDRGRLFGSGVSGVSGVNGVNAVSGANSVPGGNGVPSGIGQNGGASGLTGNGAAGASNYAAVGASGGYRGLLPSNGGVGAVGNAGAAPMTHLDAGNAGATGTGARGLLSGGDGAPDTDGGAASAPVASPLLNAMGTSGPNAGPLSGSAGVNQNSGNGGIGGLDAEASTIGGQEDSGGEVQAFGDTGRTGGGTGTIGELRPARGGGSFYGNGSHGGDAEGTGAAAAAALPR